MPSDRVLLGRYRLTQDEGSGPSGTVFRAIDAALSSTVAVKLFDPELFTGRHRQVNLFRLNRVLGFRHETLVRVNDVHAEGRTVFLVEELLDGAKPLDEAMQSLPKLRNWEVLDLFRQLASALDWIHRMGVHGNLHPGNVLVADRRVVVTDAYRLLGGRAVPSEYSAPEQHSDDPREHRESDIWALGLLLGHTLARGPVRAGLPLSAQTSGVTPALDALFLRATRKEIERRYPSVEVFMHELRAALPSERPESGAVPITASSVDEIPVDVLSQELDSEWDGFDAADAAEEGDGAFTIAEVGALEWTEAEDLAWDDVEEVRAWEASGAAAEADDEELWDDGELLDGDDILEVSEDVVEEAEAISLEGDLGTVLLAEEEDEALVLAGDPEEAEPELDVLARVAAPESAVPAIAPAVEAAPEAPADDIELVEVAPEPPAEELGSVEVAPEPPVEEVEPVEAAPEAPAAEFEPVEAAPEAPAEELEPVEAAPEPPVEEVEPVEVAPEPPSEEVEPVEAAPEAPADELEPVEAAPEAPVDAPEPIEAAPEAPPDEIEPAEAAPELPAEEPEPDEAAPELPAAEIEPLEATPDVALVEVESPPEPAPVELNAADALPEPPPLDVVPVDAPWEPPPIEPPRLEGAPELPSLVFAPEASVPASDVAPPDLPLEADAQEAAVEEAAPPPELPSDEEDLVLSGDEPPAPAAAPPAPTQHKGGKRKRKKDRHRTQAPSQVVVAAPPVRPAAAVSAALGLGTPAVPVPSGPPIAAKAPPPATPLPPPALEKPSTATSARPARRGLMAAAVVALAGCAIAAGIVFWPRDQEPPVKLPTAPSASVPVSPVPASKDTAPTAAALPPVAPPPVAAAAPDSGAVEPDAGVAALIADDVDAGAEEDADVTVADEDADVIDDAGAAEDDADAIAPAEDAELAVAVVEDADVASAAADPNTADAGPEDAGSEATTDAGIADDAGSVASVDAAVVAAADAGPVASVDAGVAAKLSCPRGMAKLAQKRTETLPSGEKVSVKTFTCIDRAEYPGGGMPSTGISLNGARGACERRGKRLCTSREWKQGCGGRAYPYGKEYDPSRCNTMSLAGEERPVAASGSFRGCRSPYGLMDMVGNVGEWTSDGMVRGGDSYKTADSAKCSYGRRRAPDSASPFVGFRCCADPVAEDAAP